MHRLRAEQGLVYIRQSLFRTDFLPLNLLPFPGQRHSLVDVGTGRQRFVEGIRRARL